MMLQPIWPVLAAASVLLVATGVWAWRQRRGQSRGDRLASAARLLLALAAVVIGLHPVGTLQVSVPQEKTTDVVVVVDRTTSMGARDWAGDRPRMDGVAADLSELVRGVAGSRVAVIVFDDEARLAVPFTTDATTLDGFWSTLGWRPSTKASGSDISVASALAEQVLRRAAEERPDHDRYVVYLGDGEQTTESAPATFGSVRELVSGALVLGYGTPEGGSMTVSDDSEELIRIDGEVATSSIDESALRGIADQLGGDYAHRTRAGGLPELVPPESTGTVTETVPGDEYYWILAIVAAGGAAILLWGAVSGLRAAREELSDAA